MTKQDREIAESAEREMEAQLKLVRALKPLDGKCRNRVLEAVGHILAADISVPGVLAAFVRGKCVSEKADAQ